MSQLLSRSIRLLLLASASIVSFSRADDEAIFRNGDIAYVSGGVGEDSRARLNAMQEFNLRLVFALGSGAFVSGVTVDVDDGAGKPLVHTISDGPIFLAHLPAGRYKLAATLGGKRFERGIAVARGKQSRLDFRWPAEP